LGGDSDESPTERISNTPLGECTLVVFDTTGEYGRYAASRLGESSTTGPCFWFTDSHLPAVPGLDVRAELDAGVDRELAIQARIQELTRTVETHGLASNVAHVAEGAGAITAFVRMCFDGTFMSLFEGHHDIRDEQKHVSITHLDRCLRRFVERDITTADLMAAARESQVETVLGRTLHRSQPPMNAVIESARRLVGILQESVPLNRLFTLERGDCHLASLCAQRVTVIIDLSSFDPIVRGSLEAYYSNRMQNAATLVDSDTSGLPSLEGDEPNPAETSRERATNLAVNINPSIVI